MTEHDPFFGTNRQELSPAGRARKAVILDGLAGRLRARRRARVAARGTALVLLFAVAVAGGWALNRSMQMALPRHIAMNGDKHPIRPFPPERGSARAIIRVVSDVGAPIAGCSPGPSAPAGICFLSDDQLVAALAETGGSYGIVRTGGEVTVVRNGP